MRLNLPIVLGLLATAGIGAASANAQISDDIVRIGVLNDQSSVYADLGGPGSVVAARMAVEDVGGKVLGKPVDIVVATIRARPTSERRSRANGSTHDKVDMVIGFDNSSVALAVEQVAVQKNRIAIAGAVATTAFTGRPARPMKPRGSTMLCADQHACALGGGPRRQNTWFFITVDYAFGNSLEADATSAVVASGGKVLGSVRHPLNTADFSSYLLQAQASGAKVVALANAGGDMINATKQANEFGLTHVARRSCRCSLSSPTSTAWGSRRRRALAS